MGELKWFILGLIALWIVWLITNGPTYQESRTRPFIEQPAPVESGKPYTLEELKERTRP